MLAIPARAFANRFDLKLVELHDGVNSFGECTFQICNFTKFRCPTRYHGTFYFCTTDVITIDPLNYFAKIFIANLFIVT